MNAQVMYELLEFIKKERPSYEEKSLRLLKFIYSDVCSSLTEQISELDGNYQELIEDFRSGITDYIDDDNSSILYYFKDLISDGKQEFIDAFFVRLDTYFKIIDNHLYREDDFIPYTLVFNIYAMLRSYNLYKDDFDRFTKALIDYSVLIEPGAFNQEYYNSGEEFCLSSKKQLFDKITGIVDFEDVPILKEKFDICYKKICNTDYDSDDLDSLVENIGFIERVVIDMRSLKEKDPDFDEKKVFEFIDSWFDYYSEDEFYFYAPILLYGNRFDYIRDSYSEYINHNEYMDEIMGVITDFNNDLFKYLDTVKKDGKDSFITCMDIVFDSDTLKEVWNKVNALKEVSDLFSLNPVPYQTVLEKIKDLSSDKYKKQVNGQKVMYVNDTVNKVDRPTSILERMVEVYSMMYDASESYVSNEIVDTYGYDETIAEFEEVVDACIKGLIEKQEQERKNAEENAQYETVSTIGGNTYVIDEKEVLTLSNENHSNEETKGIQKSIRRFFGRK